MAPDSMKHDRSFPDLVYPSLRSGGLQDTEQWLAGKTLDDGAEGLWRIQNKLYDFSSFVEKHPGGTDWLVLTKGTDITEAFECHHISTFPESMLGKFYQREAVTKRNSPFTFKEDGFYRTLKKRVREELKNIPKNVDSPSNRLIEFLAFGTFAFSILMCHTNRLWAVSILCILAGLFLAWTTICAHNFFHKKDNWRMYLFNLSTMSFRKWRVTHALSHHLYTNTLMDFEMSSFEPIFNWVPTTKKSFLSRYGSWLYFVLPYVFLFTYQIIKSIARVVISKVLPPFRWESQLWATVPLAMYAFGNISVAWVCLYWVLILHSASFIFAVIGLNAAHHHPDIFHDGDDPHEDTDWGLHQLHAVMDRTDITGSHFRVLTSFGDHGLHHLFPTLDHAALPLLYPTFEAVCTDFSTRLRMTTQLDLILGQFRQLARTKPNRKNS